jgi:uncharacterized protein (DUF4213/DUF364 family)
VDTSLLPFGERSVGTSTKISAACACSIRPGVVVHQSGAAVDRLLVRFAKVLADRGFRVMGYVQRSGRTCSGNGDGCGKWIEYLDLDRNVILPPDLADPQECLSRAVDENADLLILSRFAGCLETECIRTDKRQDLRDGLPVLTTISGRCIDKWFDYARQSGAMLTPDMTSLWAWWGPEKLYRDLALGVAETEVRRIACGSRWVMVVGDKGSGIAYLPRSPRELTARMPSYARRSLRELAELARSWNPVETALGVAAINAHYNRYDLAGHAGNGAKRFRRFSGRTVVIGAFPGIGDILPNPTVIETDPRPGEYPTVAMDILLPGCSAAVVNASVLVNRNLPHILRLTQGRPLALIGTGTPMSKRLFSYGISILGGFVVSDPAGLARAVCAGAGPRDFGRYGKYLHFIREDELDG